MPPARIFHRRDREAKKSEFLTRLQSGLILAPPLPSQTDFPRRTGDTICARQRDKPHFSERRNPMARRIQLPADSISLSAEMADRLLTTASGDAALLYLYLLRHDGFYEPEQVCRAFQWSRARLDAGLILLAELGVSTGQPVPDYQAPPTPAPSEAPEYSQEDLCQALERSNDFSALYGFVTRCYNTPSLTDRDTKMLLELYDHLGMPTEVMMMLIDHEVNEYRRKHHSTVKVPSISHIRTIAYRWKRSGVDTLEAAESYLKRLEYYRSQEGELLNAVGIWGRAAVSEEKRFLTQWIDWGFSPAVVHMAYERTLFRKQTMDWGYCNGILRRWHQEGLHTPEEIALHDGPKRPTKGENAAATTGLTPAKPVTAAQQEAEDKELEESRRQMMKILGLS